MQKNSLTQQFLSSQLCNKTDRIKISSIIPYFDKKSMNSSSKKTQYFQDRMNGQKRDCSPNQDIIRSLLKKNDQSIKTEHTYTPNQKSAKSPKALEIQESVAQLLQKSGGKYALSSPKCYNQQQHSIKKGHHSTSSQGSQLCYQMSSLIKKNDYTTTPSRKQISHQSEHSKSKSVMDFEKENDSQLQNIQTPSTFLTSLQSLGESNAFRKKQEAIKCCANHKDKKAKYLVEDDSRFYCSKCAVKLAGIGKQICEIPNDCQEDRQQEMSSFFSLLSQAQENRVQMMHQLGNSFQQMNDCYEDQMKQCDSQKEQFIQLISKVYGDAKQKLADDQDYSKHSLQKWFIKLQDHQRELREIQVDLENNWHEATGLVSEEVFRKIMDSHQIKLTEMNADIFLIQQQQIKLSYLAQSDLQATMSLIVQRYQLMLFYSFNIQDTELPLFQQNLKTQPTSSKHRQDSKMRIKTDITRGNHQNFSNYCEYFYEQRSKQVPHQGNNLYISFENKEIFMNNNNNPTLPILESYRLGDENPIRSTPHSPASGQTKQSHERTAQKEEFAEVQLQKPKSTFRTLFGEQQELSEYQDPQYLTLPSISSNNSGEMIELRKDQKGLFCSPIFKDQELLDISDSSNEK